MAKRIRPTGKGSGWDGFHKPDELSIDFEDRDNKLTARLKGDVEEVKISTEAGIFEVSIKSIKIKNNAPTKTWQIIGVLVAIISIILTGIKLLS